MQSRSAKVKPANKGIKTPKPATHDADGKDSSVGNADRVTSGPAEAQAFIEGAIC